MDNNIVVVGAGRQTKGGVGGAAQQIQPFSIAERIFRPRGKQANTILNSHIFGQVRRQALDVCMYAWAIRLVYACSEHRAITL